MAWSNPMDGDTPSVMAEKLSWLMDSWSSIELRVRIESRNHDTGREGVGLEWYIETGLGQRMYERSWPTAEPGETDRKVVYSDGKRFAESSWADGRQRNIIYTKAFFNEARTAHSWRPTPLTFFYLQHEPLATFLAKAEHLGTQSRLGRDCELLLVRNVRWTFAPVDIVYCLDRETALPLRVQCFTAGDDRTTSRPEWEWEATSIDDVGDGRHWPINSRDVSYSPEASDGVLQSRTLKIEAIHFNKEFPLAIFRPVEEPGTPVLDAVANRQYTVPGVPTGADAPAKSVASRATPPLRAEAPNDWMATVSTWGLVLGVALIAAGLLTWIKTRARGLGP